MRTHTHTRLRIAGPQPSERIYPAAAAHAVDYVKAFVKGGDTCGPSRTGHGSAYQGTAPSLPLNSSNGLCNSRQRPRPQPHALATPNALQAHVAEAFLFLCVRLDGRVLPSVFAWGRQGSCTTCLPHHPILRTRRRPPPPLPAFASPGNPSHACRTCVPFQPNLCTACSSRPVA